MLASNFGKINDPNLYNANLNEVQQQAVNTTEGALLILAGAGTGKTKVLTHRVANLIQHGIHPSQILLVTFTNKAANEMKERINHIFGHTVEGIYLGTFHSIAAKILRINSQYLDLKPDFTIIDPDDQLRLIKQLLNQHEIEEDNKTKPKDIVAIINRWKDSALNPENITNNYCKDEASYLAAKLYKEYQEQLKLLNAVDFGDLMLNNLNLFQNNPEILKHYQQKFHYIMVDEYQDTNVVQYLWLRLLAKLHKNICCVGDDDQSIYSWRGAQVGNILRFEKDFPNAKILKLEQNYRSTASILATASHLISHNRSRLGKTLWTAGDKGNPIKLWQFWDDLEEASSIADEIEQLNYKHKVALSNIAILVRASFQTRQFEENFISRNIAYKVIGGLRFYERQEIKDVIAYLRLVNQPYDLLAFERIVNNPRRGIGNVTISQVIHTAKSFNLSTIEAINKLQDDGSLKGKASLALQNFIENLVRWQNLKNQIALSELTNTIINESSYLQMLKTDKNNDNEARIENIKELVTALDDYSNLEEFLEHVSLVMDKENNSHLPMVNIMTLHAAKGLEFEVVFLPGWEHGIFPNQRSLDDPNGSLEEERRLAYVGITRAKKLAYITYANRRKMFGQYNNNLPSCFVRELPEEYIDTNLGLKDSIPKYEKIYKQYSAQAKQDNNSSNKPISENSKIGARVFHIKFGYGRIVAIDGDKFDINFEKSSRKTILSNFIEFVDNSSKA